MRVVPLPPMSLQPASVTDDVLTGRQRGVVTISSHLFILWLEEAGPTVDSVCATSPSVHCACRSHRRRLSHELSIAAALQWFSRMVFVMPQPPGSTASASLHTANQSVSQPISVCPTHNQPFCQALQRPECPSVALHSSVAVETQTS